MSSTKKVNTGIYCFDKFVLSAVINQIQPNNNQSEYYLTDVVEIAQQRGDKISVITMDDPRQVLGVNTLEQLAEAECLIDQLGR